jgi:hypothetical protein
VSTPAQPTLPGFPTRRELLGLAGTPRGAERLLSELVLRGLRAERLPAAAALVLALEAEAEEARET